jgi:hypothetical protein
VIIHCLGFVVKIFFVSKLARFMAAISIACFSPCYLSCFWVFSAKVAKSFFMWSDSCSCLRSLLRFGLVQATGNYLHFLVGPLVLRLLCSEFGENHSS